MSSLERWDAGRDRRRDEVRALVATSPVLVDVLASGFGLELGKLAQTQPSLVSLLDGARDLLGQFTPVRDVQVVVDGGELGALGAGAGPGAALDPAEVLTLARAGAAWPDPERVLVTMRAGDEVVGALVVAEPPVMGGSALVASVAAALGPVVAEARGRERTRRQAAPVHLAALLARPATDPWAEPHRLDDVVASVASLGALTGAGFVVHVGGRMAPTTAWSGRRGPVAEVVRRVVGDGEVTLEVVGGAWPRATGAAVLDRVAERVAEQVRRLDEWRRLGTDARTGLPDRTLGGMLLSEARRRMEAEEDTLAVIGVALDDGPAQRAVGRDGTAERTLARLVTTLQVALPGRDLVRLGPDRLVVVAESTPGWGAREIAGEVHDACRRTLLPTGLAARVPTARLAVVGWSGDQPGDVSRDLLAEVDGLLDRCPPDTCLGG